LLKPFIFLGEKPNCTLEALGLQCFSVKK